LRNHDLGALDSLRNPGKPVCGSHHVESQAAEATGIEAVESTSFFYLTKLPLLTYPLIIEELRPEEPPRGRFSFPDIADPDPDVGIVQRASACPPCPK
jgi:hypothetical protein